MTFSWTNTNTPCSRNSANGNNPSPVATTSIAKAADLNEVRSAVEGIYGYYHGKDVACPVAPSWDGVMASAVAGNIVSASHINELRYAVNALRTTYNVCDCNGPHCYDQGNCSSGYCCWNWCNPQDRDRRYSYFGQPGAFAWTGSDPESDVNPKRVGASKPVSAGAIQELRNAIDTMNNASTWGGRQSSGNNLTF